MEGWLENQWKYPAKTSITVLSLPSCKGKDAFWSSSSRASLSSSTSLSWSQLASSEVTELDSSDRTAECTSALLQTCCMSSCPSWLISHSRSEIATGDSLFENEEEFELLLPSSENSPEDLTTACEMREGWLNDEFELSLWSKNSLGDLTPALKTSYTEGSWFSDKFELHVSSPDDSLEDSAPLWKIVFCRRAFFAEHNFPQHKLHPQGMSWFSFSILALSSGFL